MKLKIYSILALTVFWSCITDDGNYDYVAPEEPVITLAEVYDANVGDRLLIEPTIAFSKPEALSFEWSIVDLDEMTEHTYTGDKLDIYFGLKAKLYSCRLTVSDATNGMKYFYPFSIQGHTAFTAGTFILTSVDGQAQLAFVKPDGTVQDNLYEIVNGEPLPHNPRQIVATQHQNMLGHPYLGYWLLCDDEDNPGVEIDVDNLERLRTFRENFFTEPEGAMTTGPFIRRDDATMCGIVNGKFYVGAFSTYYLAPVYGFFGSPVPGNYTLAPALAVGADGTFFWSYDAQRRALVCFIPPAGMFFDASAMPGPPAVFDPTNIGLELIHLAASNSGFFLFGKNDNGEHYELKFSTGGQMVITQYIRPFTHSGILQADSRWALLAGQEVFYISSGNTIHRYNPVNQSIETVATLNSRVSMLKILDSATLLAGEEGHLHYIGISTGQITSTISGFEGSPADVYVRTPEQ
ncbi:MAG: hypothetical protein LBR67_08890 [Dysgonamonadaceae bacterium]|nr:hypothetical protein [Dysgonamonadaceae bacterium]